MKKQLMLMALAGLMGACGGEALRHEADPASEGLTQQSLPENCVVSEDGKVQCPTVNENCIVDEDGKVQCPTVN
jgi:hypothetical protein